MKRALRRAVGAIALSVLSMVLSHGRISAVIAAPLVIAFIVATLVVLPALAGRLVGEHVFRWPALLAATAVALSNGYLLTTTEMTEGADVLSALGIASIGVFIASVTARHRWVQRPRALRGPGGRASLPPCGSTF